jgi:hypothetical protein
MLSGNRLNLTLEVQKKNTTVIDDYNWEDEDISSASSSTELLNEGCVGTY